MDEFLSIEARRSELGISRTRLCNAAGVARSSYLRAQNRETKMTASRMAALRTALHRFNVGFGREAGELAPAAAFKAALVLAAFALKGDARAAVHAQPARRATGSAEWLAAARIRQAAYHICNGCLGFRVSDIARAAGVTKGTVSMGIRDIEDARDLDDALDAALALLEELLA